jgi:hypothetical protein
MAATKHDLRALCPKTNSAPRLFEKRIAARCFFFAVPGGSTKAKSRTRMRAASLMGNWNYTAAFR